jgi:chlorite dismutase
MATPREISPQPVPQPPDRTLGHFASLRLGPSFWDLAPDHRRDLLRGLVAGAREGAERVEAYQLYPTRPEADLLLWSALSATDPAAPARFFDRFARAAGRCRPHLEPSITLWGLTRPSPYTRRGGSDREIDAVGGARERYLIVYPFSKTADWYLLPETERRELMGGHIRVGRRYDRVRQLLLYSFGLQDHEFVVVYEVDDLATFSDLVRDLRETEARRFTALDAPVLTAVHLPEIDAGPWS